LAICLWYLMKILIMQRVIIAAGLLLAVGTTNQVVAQNKTTGKKTNTVTVKKTSTSSHAAKATKASRIRLSETVFSPLLYILKKSICGKMASLPHLPGMMLHR
jgi:hypothetical protein